MTLKRGSYLHFSGENWKLTGDSKWKKMPRLVPNGMEQFMGVRQLFDKEHCVFKCLNDEFAAQPSSICELPVPKDHMLVLYDEYEDGGPDFVRTFGPESTEPSTQSYGFDGTNWKLTRDTKWKPILGFEPDDLGEPLGTKALFGKNFNVYNPY